MAMRIYLAGPWAKRETDVEDAREFLRSAGFLVDCRWIDNDSTDHSPESMCQEAHNDIQDIESSDAVVVLNNTGAPKSEGKAFETGIAFMLGLPIVVVGPHSHIFQYLPDIDVVDSLQDAVDRLLDHASGWE